MKSRENTAIPLREHPSYKQKLLYLEAAELRLAEADAARKRAIARAQGARSKRNVADRAKDLIAGGKVDNSDPTAEIRARDEEINILRTTVSELTQELDKIAGDLSYETTKLVVPAFNECMLRALQAMRDLHAAVRDAAHVADNLRDLGYRPSSVLLPQLAPEIVYMLGDPDAQGGSLAWRFKRDLDQRGII